MSNRIIVDHDTPDPWMVPAPVRSPADSQTRTFYLTFTLGNRIEIWASSSLEDFRSCRKSTVWAPQPGSPFSADIWAPELHNLEGRWYIYACGAPPGVGNPGHRTIVLRLEGERQDPMDAASWRFLGPLRGMPDGQWSIDATVFYGPTIENGRPSWGLFCCYSGWPIGDNSDTQQDLFLVRMNSPEEAVGPSLVCISKAELPWERPEGGRRGVNEGPTWVDFGEGNDKFRGIVYSAHGSWTSEYKLGILRLVGNDCADPRNWRKRPQPLLVSDKRQGGPFGPGHASFVHTPYGDGRVYCIYHGTENEGEGWANRKARVLCMGTECFRDNAMPMCCAYRSCASPNTGGVFGQVNSAFGTQPQQLDHLSHPLHTSQGPAQNRGSSGGMGAKIEGEIEKRIPPQYRGIFDKAKKFFN